MAIIGRPSLFVSARNSSVPSTDPVCSASNGDPANVSTNFAKTDEFRTRSKTRNNLAFELHDNEEDPADFSRDHAMHSSLAGATDDTIKFKSFIMSREMDNITSSTPVSSTKLSGI